MCRRSWQRRKGTIYFAKAAEDFTMKRNRLNHFADAIIGILTGYRLIMDARSFEKYGSGVYCIDLLRERVTFNGKEIAVFSVFSYLFEWFENETANNTNPAAVLSTAKVRFYVEEKSSSDPSYLEYQLFGFTLCKKRIQTYERNTTIDVILKTDHSDYSKKARGVLF